MITQLLPAGDPRSLALAAQALTAGQLVAVPTETVYGLAANALHPEAVAKIFAAKERPLFDPLICHLPDLSWLPRLTAPVTSQRLLTSLCERFWPGPLTFVLPRQPVVPDLVTAGLETVAVRLSAHPLLQSLLQKLNLPVAAPSANRFGRISPTTAQHVLEELDGRIPYIIDAGPATHGLESTVITFEQDRIRILRPGPISREELSDFAPLLETPATDLRSPKSPGQLPSHYAPATPLTLVEDLSLITAPSFAALAWKNLPQPDRFAAHEILSPAGNLIEAAATLFAKLRRLDSLHLPGILAELPPPEGLGAALRDRLQRAAHHPPPNPP